MSATYDPIKAKALFEQHIVPARRALGSDPGVYFTDEGLSVRVPTPTVTHYVITPEMLGELFHHLRCYRDGLEVQSDGERVLVSALVAHLLAQPRLRTTAGLAWEHAIKPDPQPAWRVAADKARDDGLEFSAVLDAIAAELEKDALHEKRCKA